MYTFGIEETLLKVINPDFFFFKEGRIWLHKKTNNLVLQDTITIVNRYAVDMERRLGCISMIDKEFLICQRQAIQ